MDVSVEEVQRMVRAEQAAVQAAIQEVVNTVNEGLNATGQSTRWRLEPLNVGMTAVRFDSSFLERRREKLGNQNFSVTVELVNSHNNIVLGRNTISLNRTYSINNTGFTVSDNEYNDVNFTNVNINALPPSDDLLSIRVASVNNTLNIELVETSEWYSGPWNYEIQDGHITGYYGEGEGETLTIPNTILGEPVTSIGEGVFSSSQMTSITIPYTVTSIGNGAFHLPGKSESVISAITTGEWGDISGNLPGAASLVIKIGKDVIFDDMAFTGSDFNKFYARKGRRAGTYSLTYSSNKIVRNIFMGILTPTIFGTIIPARLIPYGQWKWEYTPDNN